MGDMEIYFSENPDPEADINHYTIYHLFDDSRAVSTYNSIFITHVDDLAKMILITRAMAKCDAGICMSKDHMEQLISLGIPREKLCCVPVGLDHAVQKRKIRFGFSFRNYPDGRKQTDFLENCLPLLSPELISFKIIGSGWEVLVEHLRAQGFETVYYPDFSLDIYKTFFTDVDYALYFGMDEGAIGIADAVDAGVPVIATKQGYHLDLGDGIYALFETEKEFQTIMTGLQRQLQKRIESVSCWTWRNYASFHHLVWQTVLDRKKLSVLPSSQKSYNHSALRFLYRLTMATLKRNKRHPRTVAATVLYFGKRCLLPAISNKFFQRA